MSTATSYPREKIKVLLLEDVHESSLEVFADHGYSNVEHLKTALPENELINKIRDVHAIGIRSKSQINANVLAAANKLMAVGCFCIGTNQVDLETAMMKGIAVFNSPYSNTRSVAELVIAETIMLFRRIPERSQQAHQGVWLKDAQGSFEIRGKTIGIVGYGHIGSQVSVLAESLGMNVIYYDITTKLPLGNARPVKSLDELLKKSDAVTLHVPADQSTRMMMDEEKIGIMKKGSILLNLSRGSVVDITALKNALQSNHLAGAAVDVYPKEPKSKREPFISELQNLSNVILTPHIGGSTREAQQNIGIDAASKLVNFIETGSTMGSHTIPELNLPIHAHTHRILHVHENMPGVLGSINSSLSESNCNILGQYLNTNEKIGYVVLDVDEHTSKRAMKHLKDIDHTIRARVLY